MCSFTKFVFVKKSEKVLSFVWFTKWGELTWCRECKSITHGSVKICGWTTDNVRTYIQRGQVIPDFTEPSPCGSWRRICIYFLLFYVTFLLEIVGNCASIAGWDSCSLDKFDSLGKAQDLSCIQFFFVVLTTKWSSLLKAVNWKNTLVSLLCNICKSNVTFHMC